MLCAHISERNLLTRKHGMRFVLGMVNHGGQRSVASTALGENLKNF